MKLKVKDKNTKIFSLTNGMIADLMFFLRPMKEREAEMMFWQNQLRSAQNNISNSFSIDQSKYSIDWLNVYKTGKLVCTKLPEQKKEGEKNGESKKK
jgi:hypothetical protein